jgi:hypothetical protein
VKVHANNKKLPLTALFTQQTSIFGFVCSTKQKGLGTNLWFYSVCKKVGGHHFGKFENKQDKIDPKLGLALLNGLYSPILHSYF